MQPGLPLSLTINVSQLTNCQTAPFTGAFIDLWHCNALGVYSDVGMQSSTGRKYLRGYQATNRPGNVYFLTIYPGWYQGRTVHIHFKIRTFNGLDQSYEFTSQFFMDEAFTDEVYKLSPYNTRGSRDTRNTSDGIYNGASSTGTAITANSGSYLMLATRMREGWAEADGKVVLDLSLGSSPDLTGPEGGAGGPGGPGGGPGGPGGPPPNTPPGG